MKKEKESIRVKIYLSKHSLSNPIEDKELIKYDENETHFPQSIKLNDEINLYYKQSYEGPPKWYKKFLGVSDSKVKSTSASGLFFKTIIFNDEEYKFAFCFGSIDNILSKKHFISRFGLKLALNLASTIYSVKKNRISDTQANVKEDAIKGQEIKDFAFGINTDLLNGVIVKPVENEISKGKINGADFASFTTEYKFEELEILLKKCIEVYLKTTYKDKYNFIDFIQEIPNHADETDSINRKIIELYDQNDFGKIWFAPAETQDMESIVDYSYYHNRITDSKRLKVFKGDIDLDTVKKFISSIDMEITSIEDFKKINIEANYDDNRYIKTWNLLECIYASVSIENNQYVMNAGKIYKIENEYYRSFEDDFNNLKVTNSLMPCSETEPQYNRKVYNDNPDRFIYLDTKTTRDARKIEVCDLYDIDNHQMIHVKHYGTSSKLSHLFAQAKISAESLKSSEIKSKIMEVFAEAKPGFTLPNVSEVSIVVAIITSKPLEASQHANLPFFSKVNAVTTLKHIKEGLSYKEASMMYIPKV